MWSDSTQQDGGRVMLGGRIVTPYKVEFVTKEKVHPQKGEIGFNILKTGICGSDLLAYRGKHKYVTFPLIMGHETVGIVEEVGEDVSHIRPGDMITVQPQIVCGECYACKHDALNVCENKIFFGINIDGFFAEYCVTPAWNAIPLPKGMSSDLGMLCEPFSVASNAVDKGGVEPGMRVVVMGGGTIGNCVAQVAKAHGAEVLITDISPQKLALAEEAGIHHCMNTEGKSLQECIDVAFNNEKADVIFDCCAIPSVFNEAIACAGNSSVIVMVGTFETDVTVDLTQLQRREIKLLSVMQYNRKHFLEAIDLLSEGKLYTSNFIGGRYKLSELDQAFEYYDKNGAGILKIAIEMEGAENDT
jgi:L-iditol 2-dehydrogenase